MDSPPDSNTSNQAITNIVFSSLEESSAATPASVLSNTNNTRIKNSSFSITTNSVVVNAGQFLLASIVVLLGVLYSPVGQSALSRATGSPPVGSLDALHTSVAPNAILNAGGRADEVRCHPGTREEVLRLIEGYIELKWDKSVPRMLWLSGPAGAGKTAIMQTIAERCDEYCIPHANFFFFRADSSRSNAAALVATLLHQIIQAYPSVRDPVVAALASNPLIFQMGLREQFNTMMRLPIPAIQRSLSTRGAVVLLIDGLDECDSATNGAQAQILHALDTLLVQEGVFFRVVVASRVGPHIAMVFKQLRSQVIPISVNRHGSPGKDIRLFVTDEFYKIKSTHYLAHTLDEGWPTESDVDSIVTKSSDQFIFAATVMRFIEYSPASPRLSLQKVLGIVPPAKNSPFAYIDAVYSYILEQADDTDALLSILATALYRQISDVATIKACLRVYHPRYSDELVDSAIAELTPLVQIRNGQLQFFHASFPDFLRDKSRAGKFHLDLETFGNVMLPKLWRAGDSTQIAPNLAQSVYECGWKPMFRNIRIPQKNCGI